MITVSEENLINYEVTARIATEAFGSKEVLFFAERMKWLYERSFGQGTTVVSVSDDGVKVGQIALIRQIIVSDGEPCVAAQLVDLFILRAYRSPPLIGRVYKEVERLCLAQNIRFILAMPNEKSESLNARFLKLKPALRLHIRAGIGLRGPRSSKLKYSGHLKSMTKTAAIELLSGYATTAEGTGLRWDGETLFNRTNDPTCDYAAHATADLLLISSCRGTRGVKYTLLCGFFVRSEADVTSNSTRELIRAACRFWQHPIFVYAGANSALPRLPGFALPHRLRRPMLVQFRDIAADETKVRFDRFQLIDSDFA